MNYSVQEVIACWINGIGIGLAISLRGGWTVVAAASCLIVAGIIYRTSR